MALESTARWRRRGRTKLAFAAACGAVALPLTAAPSAAASGERHCVYSVTAHEYRCYATLAEATAQGTPEWTQASASPVAEVIGATVFEDRDYGGSSLTITVPEPCPKNDRVDFWLDLSEYWQNRISSVQAWSTCWVWLYPDSGDRAGPYKDNHPEVGAYINDRTVTVGLS